MLFKSLIYFAILRMGIKINIVKGRVGGGHKK